MSGPASLEGTGPFPCDPERENIPAGHDKKTAVAQATAVFSALIPFPWYSEGEIRPHGHVQPPARLGIRQFP